MYIITGRSTYIAARKTIRKEKVFRSDAALAQATGLDV